MTLKDPMTMALCPSTDCTGVSHLSCLCADFLEQERTEHSTPRKLAMIPRGGQCRSCRTYVLWGDVIRGCYRRKGDDAPDPEDSDVGLDDDEGQSPDDVEHIPPPTRQRKSNATSRSVHRQRLAGAAPRKRQAAGAGQVSSEGEFFDLNKVSGDSEEDSSDEPPLVGASLQRTSKTTDNPPLKARTTMERSGAIAESRSRERKSALPTRSDTARPHAVHNPKAPRVARRNAKVPLAESTAEGHPEQRPTTKIVVDPRRTQTVPQMATDDRQPPSGLPRRPAPRAKALPAYVEISDSPDSDLEEAAFIGRYKSSEALLSLYRQSPDYSPSRPGSPHGRLSRALSTLSISSGSELPDMSHLLRELGGKKKREDDEDVIVVSD
ncbi:hypothetical protein EVJ58_g1893 [Rhodofomes roseus]|uniref:Structure-specific endonuclease subunit SLX1 C-terminal domain-containing protein n=1 Tax=Rhodofomes roseus TaxID=34475 RepID=A0A4Y9YZL7_9APHY|nr:hypothetical protein EVJ58_g1893 [Rhodofomes roseus]